MLLLLTSVNAIATDTVVDACADAIDMVAAADDIDVGCAYARANHFATSLPQLFLFVVVAAHKSNMSPFPF